VLPTSSPTHTSSHTRAESKHSSVHFIMRISFCSMAISKRKAL
jgi:hypothetical protein